MFRSIDRSNNQSVNALITICELPSNIAYVSSAISQAISQSVWFQSASQPAGQTINAYGRSIEPPGNTQR
eukprot:2669139-Lingulodinium_polyedra.AAC.1